MQISLLGTGRPTGAIMVNKGGRRFVDESIYRNGAAEWTGQANNLGYFIFDSKTTSSSDAQADTIAELAEKIGVDPAVLEDTVAFWNESCALGYDREFKAVYNNNHKHDPTDTTVPENRKLRPIDTPPFFAAKRDHARLTANYTMGGLRVNTKAQVLDVYGNVLPRLYAAGVAASTTVGEMYFGSGAAIASSFIFGRIAGKNAAAETVWG
jgi:succinate dehydrogenase/fumarate reductase flavoprotein subunit